MQKQHAIGVFYKYCEEDSIEHQLALSYPPQQNGVKERKNRSIAG